MAEALGTTLGRIAASADPMPVRAQGLLVALRSAVAFDAAWLALVDPHGSGYVSVASLDLDDDAARRLGGPRTAHVAPTGTDHPAPAGSHGSQSVGLFARGGRLVGSLVLMSRSRSAPTITARRRLATLAPLLALGIDPMPCLLATARMARGVTAGTVVLDDGCTQALPGVRGDLLLAAGSPSLAVASRRLGEGALCSSFLWPVGGAFAPHGHARITVVAAPDDVPSTLAGVALVSPARDLHGLTPRELEVLGLVVDGRSNQEIATTLVVAPRTVAAHVEHLLAKLDLGSRTSAAVLAEREGLYVPSTPSPTLGGPGCGRREV